MKVTTMGQQPRAYSIHVYPAYPGSFLKIINKILDQKVCLQEDEVGFPAFLFSFSVLVLPLFFSLWFVLPTVIKIENNNTLELFTVYISAKNQTFKVTCIIPWENSPPLPCHKYNEIIPCNCSYNATIGHQLISPNLVVFLSLNKVLLVCTL